MTLRPHCLAWLFLAFSLPAMAQEAPAIKAPSFDAEAMTKRFATKLQPVLEEVLGAKFDDPVEFIPTTVEEMSKLIARENRAFLSELEGGARDEELDAQCEFLGQQHAPRVMGKIDLQSGSLCVVDASFELMASQDDSWKAIYSQRFLDQVLLHEAVHVYQNQKFNLVAFIGTPHTQAELLGCMAVIEGHAQYITREAVEKLELQDVFELFIAINTEVPPSISDPIQRTLLEAQMANLAFPYLEGEEFFTSVVGKLGYPEALSRVFETPPRTVRAVSHFEEYLNPPKDVVDLAAVGNSISALLPGDEFMAQVTPLPEGSLRAALAPAGPEKVEQALATFRGSMLIVGNSRVTPGAQVIVLVMQFDTEKGAAVMLEVEQIVQKKKDEQMQAGGASDFELVSAVYQPTKIEGTNGFHVKKEIKVTGLFAPVVARAMVIKSGKFVAEFVFSQVEGDSDSDVELGKQVVEVLNAL